jgi:hypothetical protein
MHDELAITYLLILSNQDADLYSAERPFGQDVATQFPFLVYELDEAAKCLALDRSTASAFHSIRALEAAIKALARCLGIPDPTRAVDRNWGKVLGTIETEFKRRWPTTSDRMNGGRAVFRGGIRGTCRNTEPL